MTLPDLCGDKRAWPRSRDATATWVIEVLPDGVRFLRVHEGYVVEAYGLVDARKAAVYAAAIVSGYQPPRCLCDQGKPIG